MTTSVAMLEVNGYEIKPGAKLTDAKVIDANLYDANLNGANLTGTTMPNGSKRPGLD